MTAPSAVEFFDAAYRAPLTFWGDVRVAPEMRALARQIAHGAVLELGCGIGRLSRFMAREGLRATGVDFSAVAIARARRASAQDAVQAEFCVADVTSLDNLHGPFDASFDVGCFHCLDLHGQMAYVAQLAHLLRPGAPHLLWAMDRSPGALTLSPQVLESVFAGAFELHSARSSRRRLVASHWYWFIRRDPTARPALP